MLYKHSNFELKWVFRRFFCSTPRFPRKPDQFTGLTGRLPVKNGWTLVFGLEFEFGRFLPVTGQTGRLPEPDAGGLISPVGKKNPTHHTTTLWVYHFSPTSCKVCKQIHELVKYTHIRSHVCHVDVFCLFVTGDTVVFMHATSYFFCPLFWSSVS